MKKLFLVLLLCITFCAGAQVSNTLSYQGILMQSDGVTPITDGNHTVIFGFYTVATGGTATFSRTVTVTTAKGLFTCIIGGGTGTNAPLPAGVGNQQWYIGIKVDGGAELTPRTQLTPSPYAYAALSNETGAGPVPVGGIIMWSGTIANIPAGWALCDGTNSTPDLRGRFIVGYQAGAATTPANVTTGKEINYGAIKNTGGTNLHTLTKTEMPVHNHGGNTGNATRRKGDQTVTAAGCIGCATETAADQATENHSHSISNDGGGQSHENRPPYFVLAFIMKK